MIKDDMLAVTKKFESQTQIFRSKLDSHDNAIGKQLAMIEEARTKNLTLGEKIRE